MMRYLNNLGLIALSCAGFAACSGDTGPVETGFEELPAEAIMFNVRQVMLSDGVRSALGQYDTVYYYTDSTSVRGVHVQLFGSDGQPTGELTAATGMIETESQQMVARGSVRLRTTEGDRMIETEEMHYDPSSRELWSDVATCMVEVGRVHRGTSFRSDDEFNPIHIQSLNISPGTSCS